MNVNRISSLVRAKHHAPCTSNRRLRHSNRSTAKSPAATACDPSRPYTATPQWDSRIIPTSFAPSPIAKMRFFSTDFATVTSSRFCVADTRQNNTDWHCAAARMNSFPSYRRMIPNTNIPSFFSFSFFFFFWTAVNDDTYRDLRQWQWDRRVTFVRRWLLSSVPQFSLFVLRPTSPPRLCLETTRAIVVHARCSGETDARSCWSASMSCEL